jgi:hypothetical protein
MTRISRPCYDKYHRCPGWIGGGMRWAKVDRCPDVGYITTYTEDRMKRLWKWRVHRCTKCDVIVLPYMIRYIDPTWYASGIRSRFHRLRMRAR